MGINYKDLIKYFNSLKNKKNDGEGSVSSPEPIAVEPKTPKKRVRKKKLSK